MTEGLLTPVFVTGHDHTGHPEEDDVGTGHQIVGRVVIFDVFVVRVADAVEYRDGPQPRREPGVEHVLILPQIGERQRGVAALGPGFLQCLVCVEGHYVTALGQIPGRNALAPPELARDAPVLDIFHPVTVGVLVFFGNELDFIFQDGLRRRTGELLHREKPLHRELGLDRYAGTFGITYVIGVVFGFLQQAGRVEILFDLFAQGEALHTGVQPYLVVDRAVVVEDVDRFEPVFFTEHIVVHVVRRSNLQGTRAESDVHVRIADHGYRPAHQRDDDPGVFGQPGVAFVVGIDAEGRIAEDRFGPGRGDDDRAVGAFDPVAQVVELAVRLFEHYLFVRKGGLGRRVPIDHAYAPVNQPLFIEVAEDPQDAFGTGFVHREAGALPVARGAQLAQLLQDHAAVFLFPVPGMTQELFARERRFLDPLGLEFGHHLGFRGDRGVVGARDPAGVLALHAGAAHQYVLQRVVEHMSHVEHTRDVGWRDDDRIGFPFIGFGMEKAVLHPVVVPFGFDLLRGVFVGDLHDIVCGIYNNLYRICKVMNILLI